MTNTSKIFTGCINIDTKKKKHTLALNIAAAYVNNLEFCKGDLNSEQKTNENQQL